MLENIIGSYRKSSEFCDLMSKYQTEGITYNDVVNDDTFQSFEKSREQGMQSSPKSRVIGTLAYLFRHPSRMVSAQRYYNSGFGKPCAFKK